MTPPGASGAPKKGTRERGAGTERHAHGDLLHEPTWPLEELYYRHTPQHHAVYVHEDMTLSDFRELELVLLPAYGVARIAVMTSPVTATLWVRARYAVPRSRGRARSVPRRRGVARGQGPPFDTRTAVGY